MFFSTCLFLIPRCPPVPSPQPPTINAASAYNTNKAYPDTYADPKPNLIPYNANDRESYCLQHAERVKQAEKLAGLFQDGR